MSKKIFKFIISLTLTVMLLATPVLAGVTDIGNGETSSKTTIFNHVIVTGTVHRLDGSVENFSRNTDEDSSLSEIYNDNNAEEEIVNSSINAVVDGYKNELVEWIKKYKNIDDISLALQLKSSTTTFFGVEYPNNIGGDLNFDSGSMAVGMAIYKYRQDDYYEFNYEFNEEASNQNVGGDTRVELRINGKQYSNIGSGSEIVVNSLDISDITVLKQNGSDIEGKSDSWSMSTNFLDNQGRGVLEVQTFETGQDYIIINLVSHYGDCPGATDVNDFQIMMVKLTLQKQTISKPTKNESVTSNDKNYKKAQKITTAKIKAVKVKTLKKKAVTIKLKAKASGRGKLTYKVTKYPKGMKKFIKVSKKGVITLKKKAKKGSYKIKITAAAKGNYKKATKTITIKVK